MIHLQRMLVLTILVCPLLAGRASAQDGYLFRTPQLTVGVRLGAALPAANDDVFRFMTNQLTLERDDFASTAFGGDIGFRLHPQVVALLSVTVSRSSTDSEFRDWLDEDDRPIEQVTNLRRVPLTAGLKVYPVSRGRTLGKHAWVPARFLPYVGGGAGIMWYRLEQVGDFVDFETLDIFEDYLASSGEAATVHAFAGTELWLMPKLGLNVEARYLWGSADLKDAFADFDRIDLRGFQLTSGLMVRF